MRQLLVECSDPGWVVSLAEELENVLRHIDFERARALRAQLAELARELGPEFDEDWRGFGIETPSDTEGRPLSFGNRNAADADRLKVLAEKAEERGIGKFTVRSTGLLPQDGPMPETREQYVDDLSEAIRGVPWGEWGVRRSPIELPEPMAAHRLKVIEQYGGAALRELAAHPTVGHHWVQESADRLRKVMEAVATRSEAVMEYELTRLDPEALEWPERLRWALLAARMGTEVEKWQAAAERSLAYTYQRAALIRLMWTESRGWGPARSLLDERLKALVDESRALYTADGHEAMRKVLKDLRRSPWAGLGILAEDEDEDGEGDADS